ncbi:MAG: 50S ribosomal protein L30 [Lentimicrobium sp.]|jgi:large subunit ribosomal protein L30|nr:50S ribosomal protein L30 [Lentimicrobium sp.]
MKKLRVTQIRSGINQPERQKRTLQALGIKGVNRPIEVVATPQIEGMIAKLNHLLKVEEI